jgi:hypothetical protein
VTASATRPKFELAIPNLCAGNHGWRPWYCRAESGFRWPDRAARTDVDRWRQLRELACSPESSRAVRRSSRPDLHTDSARQHQCLLKDHRRPRSRPSTFDLNLCF